MEEIHAVNFGRKITLCWNSWYDCKNPADFHTVAWHYLVPEQSPIGFTVHWHAAEKMKPFSKEGWPIIRAFMPAAPAHQIYLHHNGALVASHTVTSRSAKLRFHRMSLYIIIFHGICEPPVRSDAFLWYCTLFWSVVILSCTVDPPNKRSLYLLSTVQTT